MFLKPGIPGSKLIIKHKMWIIISFVNPWHVFYDYKYSNLIQELMNTGEYRRYFMKYFLII